MEIFAEGLSVIGALLLSVSCGLLVEEMVFGVLARLFFARQPGAVRKRSAVHKENTHACVEVPARRRGSAVAGCRSLYHAVRSVEGDDVPARACAGYGRV